MKPLFLVLLIPWLRAQAMPHSPFNGVWKVGRAESPSSAKTYAYLLQDNTYHCTTCDPPLDIRADGQDQKIIGEPCYDTVSLKVVDDWTTLETDKKNGKTVGSSRMTVSSDGSSATLEWKESCNANGDVVSGTDILSRITKGLRGIARSFWYLADLEPCKPVRECTRRHHPAGGRHLQLRRSVWARLRCEAGRNGDTVQGKSQQSHGFGKAH